MWRVRLRKNLEIERIKGKVSYDSSGEGPKPDETKPSTGLAGGWVSRTCWPNLSQAADRPRNISTAVWPESLALHGSSGCGAITTAKRNLRGHTFLSRETTHHHRHMTPFGTEDSDVLGLVCVPSILGLLEWKKNWFPDSFFHSSTSKQYFNTFHVPGTRLYIGSINTNKTLSQDWGSSWGQQRGVEGVMAEQTDKPMSTKVAEYMPC